jgi:hypothetical protein
MKQGEQFAAASDLPAARLAFQRAAEAGDATAALAMGATYDPIVLAKLGFRGVIADAARCEAGTKKPRSLARPKPRIGLSFLRTVEGGATSTGSVGRTFHDAGTFGAGESASNFSLILVSE